MNREIFHHHGGYINFFILKEGIACGDRVREKEGRNRYLTISPR